MTSGEVVPEDGVEMEDPLLPFAAPFNKAPFMLTGALPDVPFAGEPATAPFAVWAEFDDPFDFLKAVTYCSARRRNQGSEVLLRFPEEVGSEDATAPLEGAPETERAGLDVKAVELEEVNPERVLGDPVAASAEDRLGDAEVMFLAVELACGDELKLVAVALAEIAACSNFCSSWYV